MSDDLIIKLALSFLKGMGPISLRKLVALVGSPREVFSMSREEINSLIGSGSHYFASMDRENALERALLELKIMNKKGIRLLHYMDEEFPALLNTFPDGPVNLFIKGEDMPGEFPALGVVGTRSPTNIGIRNTRKLIEQFRNNHIHFVSGLAYGIDITMHRACIEHDLVNFAVLGHGLDIVYPYLHKDTAEKIMKKGALLSEYPTGTKPDRTNFPQRNRIIAGLCQALVVVESKIKGGSMITAEYANSYQRDVFAFPGRVQDDLSIGCNHLIKSHRAHLLQSSDDIFYITRWEQGENETPQSFRQSSLFIELDPSEQKILSHFKTARKVHIDELKASLNLESSNLYNLLLHLELKGFIRPLPGKYFTTFV